MHEAADGVVVLTTRPRLEVRTELLTRPGQSRSIQVANVQAATVEGGPRREAVMIDEAEREVVIAGHPCRVRVLHSYSCFRFELEAADGRRRVAVAGALAALDDLALVECDRAAPAATRAGR